MIYTERAITTATNFIQHIMLKKHQYKTQAYNSHMRIQNQQNTEITEAVFLFVAHWLNSRNTNYVITYDV